MNYYHLLLIDTNTIIEVFNTIIAIDICKNHEISVCQGEQNLVKVHNRLIIIVIKTIKSSQYL